MCSYNISIILTKKDSILQPQIHMQIIHLKKNNRFARKVNCKVCICIEQERKVCSILQDVLLVIVIDKSRIWFQVLVNWEGVYKFNICGSETFAKLKHLSILWQFPTCLFKRWQNCYLSFWFIFIYSGSRSRRIFFLPCWRTQSMSSLWIYHERIL